MVELERKIHGDWFEIREILDDVYAIDEYLNLSTAELNILINDLRLSVESGILEYKRSVVLKTYEFMESMNFDTKQFAMVDKFTLSVTKLLYTVLLEKLFAKGLLVPGKQEKEDVQLGEEFQEKDIKTIMTELQAMVKKEPALVQRNEVKSILLQFKMYQKELTEMSKLKNNIPKEKLPAFLGNFKNTLDGLTKKIQTNYNLILAEKTVVEVKQEHPKGDLRRYNISKLTPLLAKQAEIISNIRSRMLFASEERYHTREAFKSIPSQLEELKKLIRSEEEFFAAMELREAALIGKSFSIEIIRRIEKNLNVRL
ncbi:MAG: hypothetical protein JEY99_03720 [Spirochaetales bacterium]|nr:hypothetical protein [Spirochaetales bacterium]